VSEPAAGEPRRVDASDVSAHLETRDRARARARRCNRRVARILRSTSAFVGASLASDSRSRRVAAAPTAGSSPPPPRRTSSPFLRRSGASASDARARSIETRTSRAFASRGSLDGARTRRARVEIVAPTSFFQRIIGARFVAFTRRERD